MQEHTGTQNDNFSSRLIFEKSRKNTFQKCPHLPDALARSSLAIPELSEPEVIRHYTALSKLNFGMDTGMYPLGSCTMKYNPRFTEYLAALAQNRVHPYQDETTIVKLEFLPSKVIEYSSMTFRPISTSPSS